MGTKVVLNIYDLSPINDYLYTIGFGLHHSGVEIQGSEYSFASGGGIFSSTPKDAPGAIFRESIEMGVFEGSTSDIQSTIDDLRNDLDQTLIILYIKIVIILLMHSVGPCYVNLYLVIVTDL